MTPLRIVLTEDHALVRKGIRALVDTFSEIEVVGEAGDGQEVLQLIDQVNPDVLVLDLTLPGLNGMNVIARLTKSHPSLRILILSMHANEEYVRQALQLGATGYLLKDTTVEELELALRTVARGETFLCAALSRRIVDDYVRRVGTDSERQRPLTLRQTEILQLIAEGKSTKQIAHHLKVSVKTVDTHRAQICERLGIGDMAGLIRYAIRNGLVTQDF